MGHLPCARNFSWHFSSSDFVLTSKRQTVWENYKEPEEIFPGPVEWTNPELKKWNTVRSLPPKQAKKYGTHPRRLLEFEDLTEYTAGSTQLYFFAFRTGPLYDRHGGLIRYEVAVNRSFFKYIHHFEYYNAQKQADAVWYYIQNADPASRASDKAFQRPPFGNPTELNGYLKGLPCYDSSI